MGSSGKHVVHDDARVVCQRAIDAELFKELAGVA
jgi:hypothetical protein